MGIFQALLPMSKTNQMSEKKPEIKEKEADHLSEIEIMLKYQSNDLGIMHLICLMDMEILEFLEGVVPLQLVMVLDRDFILIIQECIEIKVCFFSQKKKKKKKKK